MILALIVLMPQYTIVKKLYCISNVYLCYGIYLHRSSVVASQESCFGSVENSEHTKDTLSKDVNNRKIYKYTTYNTSFPNYNNICI